ncbi:MAG TPA: GNAT family N-acetyltransferase [Candidatus Limnocylindrales bacterium]|nr:GNAT family N-acetyltransferase [Candidatus Limnocylindrales bacterium]
MPPSEEHRYLAFVGVEPGVHGQGIGTALLAPGLAEADSGGLVCYLETPFPETIPFYEGLGIEVERELPLTFGLGPLWTMRRAPGGSPST